MPDGIDLKRIIDLDPETTVTDDDYTIVDSTTGGAKKFAIGQALGEIKDGLQAVQTEVAATLITDTASGAIASFPDGADNVPVKSLTVEIEPVQSGSGDPSPTNIRPISGHTSAVVTRTGGNLINLQGTLSANTNSDPITLPAGDYYTYIINSSDGSGYNSPVQYLDGTTWKNFDGTQNDYGETDAYMGYYRKKSKITLYKTCTIRQNLQVNSSVSGSTFYVMWTTDGSAYASTPNAPTYASLSTLYTPYVTPQNYTISLDGTIYGGTLDVTTGVLTVTDANIASYNGETLPSTWISDRDVYASGTNPTTGAQVVYKLATPITVQLTAEEVTTLLGQNNIWSDAGDVEVEYRADTKLYIEKLTAPTEDDMIADHAISANTFFMVGNTLYRATTAIASGATITVGTNATRLSLADALNTLS